MKLHLLDRSSVLNKSLTVSHHLYPNFLRVWHYHPEFELVVILQSSGTRFIGDSIAKFQKGEVILLGKNLPHMWLNDKAYFLGDKSLQAEAIAVHFKREFLGRDFLEIPEMKAISVLFDRAERGIIFLEIENTLIAKIKRLVECGPATRIIKIIEVLNELAKHRKYQLLSSSSFTSSFHKQDNRRLDKIYEFVFQNFNDNIHASDVANIAGMNRSAFSRFFKKIHRKSFTKYLNEIRVGYACKLLLENQESITAIAYLSGFNNISNFNRQFRNIHGKSPSSYLKDHQFEGQYTI